MRRLTPFSLNAGDHPDWSPDGNRILFRSRADVTAPGALLQLYTVRPDGTDLKRLTRFRHTRGCCPRLIHRVEIRSPSRWPVTAPEPDLFAMHAERQPDSEQLRGHGRGDSAPDWVRPWG